MKKILYLITQTEFGGAQKYVLDLAMNLKNKYIIEIAHGENKNTDWMKDLKDSKIKIYRLKHVVRELNIFHDFLSAFELLNLFFKTKPDIVHLNSSKIGSTGAVMAWIYKKLSRRKVKIIYTVHGFVFEEPLPLWRKKFYLFSERVSGFFKDKLICVSEQDKIIGLNKKIARHDKFITIHNGIDLKNLKFLEKDEARRLLYSRRSLPRATMRGGNDILRTTTSPQPSPYKGEGDELVGTIANLYSTKGLEYLIRAAKIITEKNQNIIFVVIGEGGQRKFLEKEITRLNLQNNFFLIGAIPNAATYLKAFDIFALSSVKEGFPYTPIEAMAAGLPIIATRVGGVLEIVEPDINGLVVEQKKSREIAGAIEKILKDENLKNKFIKNNIEKVGKFDLGKMISETEGVYND
jgi:glycosyltransferase involved in cell wall biosynthesis